MSVLRPPSVLRLLHAQTAQAAVDLALPRWLSGSACSCSRGGSRSTDDLSELPASYFRHGMINAAGRQDRGTELSHGRFLRALEVALERDALLRERLVERHGFVVHRVHLAEQKRKLHVLWDCHPGRAAECEAEMSKLVGRLRDLVARNARAKATPFIQFKHDHLSERATATALGLEQILRERAAHQRPQGGEDGGAAAAGAAAASPMSAAAEDDDNWSPSSNESPSAMTAMAASGDQRDGGGPASGDAGAHHRQQPGSSSSAKRSTSAPPSWTEGLQVLEETHLAAQQHHPRHSRGQSQLFGQEEDSAEARCQEAEARRLNREEAASAAVEAEAAAFLAEIEKLRAAKLASHYHGAGGMAQFASGVESAAAGGAPGARSAQRGEAARTQRAK